MYFQFKHCSFFFFTELICLLRCSCGEVSGFGWARCKEQEGQSRRHFCALHNHQGVQVPCTEVTAQCWTTEAAVQVQSAPDALLEKIYTSLTNKQHHFAFCSLFLRSELHPHRLWNTLQNPSLSRTLTFSGFTTVFLYHLQLIFTNSHFWSHAGCLTLMKITSTCLVWVFSFFESFSLSFALEVWIVSKMSP